MAKFKNISNGPVAVDLGKKSFVVMPGVEFEAPAKHPEIKKLLDKGRQIARV